MSSATSAASRSLSPKRISCVATVSFSFTIGRIRSAEQAVHGALGVRARRRVLEVARGQQHLAGDDAVAVERVLVAEDEQVLPDGCRGLLRREVGGPRVEPEVRHARGDRARRDEHDLGAALVGCGEGVDERADLAGVLAADRRGADLHDDPPRLRDLGARARDHRSSPAGSGRRPARSPRRRRRSGFGAAASDPSARRRPRGRPRARAAARRAPRPWRPCARGSRSRRSARVARRFSSRRRSVPRGAVMSSAVEVRVGSQSKTTPDPGPMTTVEPATAPARNSSSSTPSFARRSARKPTASSFVKSVCAPSARASRRARGRGCRSCRPRRAR